MKINFLFSKSDGKSINLDVLFHAGPGSGGGERVATAVLIGEAIYYTWRL